MERREALRIAFRALEDELEQGRGPLAFREDIRWRVPAQVFDLEDRAAENGKLRGYAAVFDSDSVDMGFVERIAPGAFKRTLKEGANVRMLWNHDSSLVLASRDRSTITLREDAKGLYFEAEPNPELRQYVSQVERGDVHQMSFGFRVVRDEIDQQDTDTPVRTLLDVDLFEVSPVTFPAYQATSVALRSAVSGVLERLQEEPELTEVEIRRMLAPRDQGSTPEPPAREGHGVPAVLQRHLELTELEGPRPR